jgi:hypothetical protein
LSVMTERIVECGAPAEAGAQVDEARRDAMRRISKFAGYTAPALLVMLTSAPAAAGDSL